jgi:hypothetical protein
MYSRLLIAPKHSSALRAAWKSQANSVLHAAAQSHARRGGKRRLGTDGMFEIVLRHDENCASMKRDEVVTQFDQTESLPVMKYS